MYNLYNFSIFLFFCYVKKRIIYTILHILFEYKKKNKYKKIQLNKLFKKNDKTKYYFKLKSIVVAQCWR